ncbi:hypothetical protein A1F94_007841 [Pyrenophora tritici-repentis]|nr:hypothetical protein A1F94_007841 [Pyrenophora tritici-repentis]
MDRAIKKMAAIKVFMHDNEKHLNEIRLTSDDWDILQKHIHFTTICISNAIRGGDKSSISQSLLIMDSLLVHYEQQRYITLKMKMRTFAWFDRSRWAGSYLKYYNMTDQVPVYASAILLNPASRAAYLKKNWPAEWYEPAINAAQNFWVNEFKDALPLASPTASQQMAPPLKQRGAVLDQILQQMSVAAADQSNSDDLKIFAESPVIQIDSATDGAVPPELRSAPTTRHRLDSCRSQSTRLSDLSSAGQRAYKDDLEIYKLKMEQYKTKYARYKTEITNLQHIMILVQSTVAVHLQRTCCPPDGSIRDWIKNLRAHVGITIETEREQARQRYYSALKPPRSANNWDTWLAEYNQAVTEAETLKVPDTTQFRSVAVDFMSAVNKIAPIWAATFQSNGMDQPGVTQKDMMRRFREYMMLNHPITRNRSQKAAFAVDDPSVFLAANSNADQRVDGDTHHVETGNSQRKAIANLQALQSLQEEEAKRKIVRLR